MKPRKIISIFSVDLNSHLARKKAAAEGAAIWFTKQLVIARAVRSTFGVIVHRIYDPSSAVHNQRKHKVFTDEDGNRKITGFFDYCVKKVGLLALRFPTP